MAEGSARGEIQAIDSTDQLRRAGLRLTAPRIAVLEALKAAPHSSADAVAETARHRLGSVSTQAVYDVLNTCTEAGIVRRIQPAGAAALYEMRVQDNHHHAVCRTCAATTDVDCVVGAAPCLEPGTLGGFAVDEAEVIFWGFCAACQSSNRT